LVQLSPANTDAREILEAQLRECFGRVVYSHKTHEKCADILLSQQSWIKLGQIVLSALTTAGFIGAMFGSGQAAAILGTLVSTGLLALNAYTKDYDLGAMAQKHKQAASGLWLVREKYLSLITDLRMKKRALDEILKDRDALLEQLKSVYSGAPSTTNGAYRKAQEALKRYEDMTFSDEEIDAFLPTLLKKSDGQPSLVEAPTTPDRP
jgi:SMODS and SLOG-associating 2TM effector domain family 4